MDSWTLIVGGLAVVPAIGLVFTVLDLRLAYRQSVLVSEWLPGSVEAVQARHTVYAQAARATCADSMFMASRSWSRQ